MRMSLEKVRNVKKASNGPLNTKNYMKINVFADCHQHRYSTVPTQSQPFVLDRTVTNSFFGAPKVPQPQTLFRKIKKSKHWLGATQLRDAVAGPETLVCPAKSPETLPRCWCRFLIVAIRDKQMVSRRFTRHFRLAGCSMWVRAIFPPVNLNKIKGQHFRRLDFGLQRDATCNVRRDHLRGHFSRKVSRTPTSPKLTVFFSSDEKGVFAPFCDEI